MKKKSVPEKQKRQSPKKAVKDVLGKALYAKAARLLRVHGVGVLATDTLFGLVARASSRKAVERVYRLRRRNPSKPCIILIDSIDALQNFGLKLTPKTKQFLESIWPGKVSVILPCSTKKFFYLHRGTKELAFRVPADLSLRKFLKTTGPLIAPSANVEGERPAKTLREAWEYFGMNAQFYVGTVGRSAKPSTVIRVHDGSYELVRQGAVPQSSFKKFATIKK